MRYGATLVHHTRSVISSVFEPRRRVGQTTKRQTLENRGGHCLRDKVSSSDDLSVQYEPHGACHGTFDLLENRSVKGR
jgi:hypothetical protein